MKKFILILNLLISTAALADGSFTAPPCSSFGTISGTCLQGAGALGSPLSIGTLPAFTLGGTIAGGGNQINNIVIGNLTPNAGSFSTLSASSLSTLTGGLVTGNGAGATIGNGTLSLNNGGGVTLGTISQNGVTGLITVASVGGGSFGSSLTIDYTAGTVSIPARLTVGGHVTASGATPTISSCGVSPSISGSDNFGSVTAGTGILSSCVINFGVTWGSAPRCVASSSTAIASMTVSATTTQLTIGGTSLTSDAINWICGSTS